MKKIIIDCDPGHDDALALLLALSEKKSLEIHAVGTVGGNHPLEEIIENARMVLQSAGAKSPLYAGYSKPLNGVLRKKPHDRENQCLTGRKDDEKISYPIKKEHAVEGYREILERNNDIIFVALGPLTNLAVLLELHPEIKHSIKCISLMGGGIRHGNVTPYAEFNIYSDPEAARTVFSSGLPIIMSSLDVTTKAYLKPDEIEILKEGKEVQRFTYDLMMDFLESGKTFGQDTLVLHDLCAVAVLTRPNLFTEEDMSVKISCEGITRGMTCVDLRPGSSSLKNVRVVRDVNRNGFADYVISRILSYNLGDEDG